ncbi:MAG: hypothetical protein E7647_07390 [Ruminococcaceae bacterium]|nr:hypothetical protein [Oscillospiraceae bacterium]
MKKSGEKHSGFFKSLWLLIRCLFGSLSFTALWLGILIIESPIGITVTVIGALASLLSVYANIIVPVIRLR